MCLGRRLGAWGGKVWVWKRCFEFVVECVLSFLERRIECCFIVLLLRSLAVQARLSVITQKFDILRRCFSIRRCILQV